MGIANSEMTEDVAAAKRKIRRAIVFQLKSQKEEDRINRSRQIKNKLFNLPEFKQAHIIMFYVSTKFEVNTEDMIKKAIKLGKKVALPIISKDAFKMEASFVSGGWQLVPGPYNIRQPKEEYRNAVSAKDLDLVIVPGIAFDEEGVRLGRGKGYYDRFLREKSDTTHTVGLAFSFQIVKRLPFSRHDYPIETVISA